MHHSSAIGLSSTLLAVTIPETWLSYGGRFAFAIFTAVCASLISRAIANLTSKK